MSQTLTLSVYLERRGPIKALTSIEAEAFGVPYPLLKGWATRHGATEITQVMLDQLQEKIGRSKSSTAEKAQRGLNGVEGLAPALASARQQNIAPPHAVAASVERISPIPGFVLRLARRYRTLRPPSRV